MTKLKFEAFIEQKKGVFFVDYPFFTIFILIKHRIKIKRRIDRREAQKRL